MNARQCRKYKRSFAISRIRLIAAVDAGAVHGDVEVARVTNGRRDGFLDCLFARNVAKWVTSLPPTVSIRPIVSFNVE
jgi:hypothetical protein